MFLCVCSRSVMCDSLQPHVLQPIRFLLSMEFSRQEYWSGLPFPSPGNLPDPGIRPRLPVLQADSLPLEPHKNKQKSHIGTQVHIYIFWLLTHCSHFVTTLFIIFPRENPLSHRMKLSLKALIAGSWRLGSSNSAGWPCKGLHKLFELQFHYL